MTDKLGLFDRLTKIKSVLPEETVDVDDIIKKLNAKMPKGAEKMSLWGTPITLRGWTARERDLFEEDNYRRNKAKQGNGGKPINDPANMDLTNWRARLVSRSIIDDGGMRVFWSPAGEEWLGEQPAAVIDALFAVAQRLNGITNADVEELTKNSGETEEGVSSSVSPSPSTEPLPN